MFKNIKTLTGFIIASNVIYTVLPIISYYILPLYSPQNTIILDQWNPLSATISFDGIHFLTNTYKHEKNYAFLPGFVIIIRLLELIFSPSITILIVLIINKISTVLASTVLMNITILITGNHNLGKLTAIIFLFNPASIFYHAVYSQAIYSLIILSGIYLSLQKQLRNKQKFLQSVINPYQFIKSNLTSLILLGGACLFRTTGIFLSLIVGIPIIEKLFTQMIKKQLTNVIKIIITGGLTLSFFLVSSMGYLYLGYRQFCIGKQETPTFCQSLIPNIYQFVQVQFWNCGFLTYYAPQRAFFIILGIPSLIISLITITSTKLIGLNYSYYILVFITFTYSNIQSSARFFSSHPLYIIGLAQYLTINGKLKRSQKIVVFYLVLYNCFGLIMFPHRFPWT